VLKDGYIVDDRYVVEKKLGEGGLAAVFRVRHQRLGTTYALKLLKQDSEMIRSRLMREGELQGKLRHPNIAAVTDVVDVNGVPGLIMEFVRGSSLDVLLWNEQLTEQQVDHLAVGIMRGVGAAHAAGTIHRDLKPANILLEVVDGVLTPKVTDFGLAKALDGYTETAAGVMMGTPQYMAPEQIDDASTVDASADVFSLGVMLFEMCSGERPFDGANIAEVLQKVFDDDRKSIQEAAPDLAIHKQKAIEQALSVDPAERPDVPTLLTMWTGEEADTTSGGFTSSALRRALARGQGESLPGETPAPAGRRGDDLPDPVAPLPLSASPGTPLWQKVTLVVVALAALGTVATSIAGTGVLAFVLGRSAGDGTATSVPAPPTPAAKPGRPPALVTRPRPAPVAPVSPAPGVPSPEPAVPEPSTPAPAPAAPAPVRPAPTAQPTPARATLRVEGDARAVRFSGAQSGLTGGGELPAGVYRVHVTFEGQPEFVAIDSLVVEGGSEVTILCSSLTFTCTRKL